MSSAREALDRSYVVEASASETTALVVRMVDAIAAGTAVHKMVAITFTHGGPIKELS